MHNSYALSEILKDIKDAEKNVLFFSLGIELSFYV